MRSEEWGGVRRREEEGGGERRREAGGGKTAAAAAVAAPYLSEIFFSTRMWGLDSFVGGFSASQAKLLCVWL